MDPLSTNVVDFEAVLDNAQRTQDVVGNVATESLEEVLETGFKKFNLGWLLFRDDGFGAIARFIAATPDDVRLVALNTVAAVIDTQPGMNRVLRRLIATAIRALPRALPDMFRQTSTPDEVTQNAEDIANELGRRVSTEALNRVLHVGMKQTDVIHDQAIHPSQDGELVNKGNVVDIISRFGDIQPFCPVCFRGELATGVIRVVTEVSPPAAAPEPVRTPLANLVRFRDPIKRQSIVDLNRLSEQEMRGDTGAGTEGFAFRLSNVLAAMAGTDPEALEALVPDGGLALEGPLRSTLANPVRIDEATQRFISALFLAFNVDHPMPSAQVAVGDAVDNWRSWLPADLRPRQNGWRGVNELRQNIATQAPAVLRAIDPWVTRDLSNPNVENTDSDNKVKKAVRWTVYAFVALNVLGALAGAFTAGFALARMPWWMNLSGAMLVLWRAGVRPFDVPITAVVGLFRRLTGSTDTRDPVTVFVDIAIVVCIVGALVCVFGNVISMLSNPYSNYPAYALIVIGAWLIYYPAEMLRRGWRLIGPQDDNRYVGTSFRVKLYRYTINGSGLAAALSILIGVGLGLRYTPHGSAMLLDVFQKQGDQQVVQMAEKGQIVLGEETAKDKQTQAETKGKKNLDLACSEAMKNATAVADREGRTLAWMQAGHEREFPFSCKVFETAVSEERTKIGSQADAIHSDPDCTVRKELLWKVYNQGRTVEWFVKNHETEHPYTCLEPLPTQTAANK